MLSHLIAILAIAIGLAGAPAGKDEQRRRIFETMDPLAFANLVVRGDVVWLETRIGGGDIGPDSLPNPIYPVSNLRVVIREVLAGETDADTLDVDYRGGRRDDVALGAEVVLCLNEAAPTNGVYRTHPLWYFRREGDRWLRGQSQARMREIIFSMAEIRKRAHRASYAELAAEADGVLQGTVASTHPHYMEEAGQRYHVTSYAFHPVRWLRGQPQDGESVEMLLVSTATGSPAWWSFAPLEPKVGETWYLFLQRIDAGFTPVRGLHGMYRIDDDRLLYLNRTPIRFDRAQMDSIVTGAGALR